jgi:hypothetical protein
MVSISTGEAVLHVCRESIKIRTASRVVKAAPEAHITIKQNGRFVKAAPEEHITIKLNSQVVKVAIKASGQTILVVPQIARSATKESTMTK